MITERVLSPQQKAVCALGLWGQSGDGAGEGAVSPRGARTSWGPAWEQVQLP